MHAELHITKKTTWRGGGVALVCHRCGTRVVLVWWGGALNGSWGPGGNWELGGLGSNWELSGNWELGGKWELGGNWELGGSWEL